MTPTAAERNTPRWRSEDRMPGWVGAICLASLAFFLRRWHIGTPHQFSFDETYYAKDAWSLLNHGYVRAYVEDADKTILNGNVTGLPDRGAREDQDASHGSDHVRPGSGHEVWLEFRS